MLTIKSKQNCYNAERKYSGLQRPLANKS